MSKKQQYKRISKDIISSEIDNLLNDNFNDGWKVIYYNERIMSTENVWISVVFEKRKYKDK